MSTISDVISLVTSHGSDVIFHRDDSMVDCPCLTPEGFRDPEWHIANPSEPVCNEQGKLSDPSSTTNVSIKAFVQPAQSMRLTRLGNEILQQMFENIETDDHVGIFPCEWGGTTLNFYEWSQDGEDYIIYNGRKFFSVNANLIPDPSDGNPFHHWEVALRLIAS